MAESNLAGYAPEGEIGPPLPSPWRSSIRRSFDVIALGFIASAVGIFIRSWSVSLTDVSWPERMNWPLAAVVLFGFAVVPNLLLRVRWRHFITAWKYPPTFIAVFTALAVVCALELAEQFTPQRRAVADDWAWVVSIEGLALVALAVVSLFYGRPGGRAGSASRPDTTREAIDILTNPDGLLAWVELERPVERLEDDLFGAAPTAKRFAQRLPTPYDRSRLDRLARNHLGAISPSQVYTALACEWDLSVALAALRSGLPVTAVVLIDGQADDLSATLCKRYASALARAQRVIGFTPASLNEPLPVTIRRRDDFLVSRADKLLVLCEEDFRHTVMLAATKQCKPITNVWIEWRVTR